MKRIFSDDAYGPGPRAGCWWDETAQIPLLEPFSGDLVADVVVVGAGFTGVSAALHLAWAGASVVVVDSHKIGWGASGRNGGFCCLGGAKASDTALDRRFGRVARLEYRSAEKAAVALVERLIARLDLDVDRHSGGETLLAHRPRDAHGFETEARAIEENYGVTPRLHDPATSGLGGPFFGALTTPIGFGLNPRKYLAGLVRAAMNAGVRFVEDSPVTAISKKGVATAKGQVKAQRVVLATNGYSSEDIPEWLRARYMPAQSTVLVTRPLSPSEQDAQGWTSDQMAYDTRHLLHYFRRLPDQRFLFGMRGALGAGPRADARARRQVLRDFHRMFPAWTDIGVTHSWSGLVCLSRGRVPFVGPVPNADHILAGFAYHGNGVAMGSFAGACLAALAQGRTPEIWPSVMRHTPARFPFGGRRRVIMPFIYAGYAALDF